MMSFSLPDDDDLGAGIAEFGQRFELSDQLIAVGDVSMTMTLGVGDVR